jgi:D-alanyl-D-alanine carboxypeptidase/D-alanyl-D-alanine-endopeptidase (penicillin-binding protein 4)
MARSHCRMTPSPAQPLFQRLAAATFAVLLGALWLTIPVMAPAAPPVEGLGPHDALLVLDPDGRILLSHNPDQLMVPASTLKVLTSLAAFHYLGPDYRFPTDFLLDDGNNLVIRGYGDPLLVSEVIAASAHQLAGRLPRAIHDILLDTTYFEGPLTIPGVSTTTNPYDAPIGALCANFNTVFFTRVDGKLQSAEEQTPILPMVVERIRRSGLQEGRIVLSRRQNEAPLYAGRLFRYFLEQEGFVIGGDVRMAPAGTSGAHLVYRHLSPYDLSHVVQRLLEFSNNFTANQLLMAMGARCYGPPATLAKGVQALKAYAGDVAGITDGVFVEGSGISRLNRLSARDMAAVLARFSPHADLMSHKNREYYKTGTLKGIRTRVGYIEDPPGRFYRFVLFRNQPGTSTGPVMHQIHRFLAGYHP